ncbi:MAG: response regulator transcription factor [Rhodoferax sp.]|nr:response regulator transcription factor [Rhodoferax sp.]MDP3650052.1 response regulator transcription factor [Rhodoferax sp.]
MKPASWSPSEAHSPDFTVSIVEDEPVLRQEIAFQLDHMGFSVKTFDSAPAFYRYLAVRPRTIAVLDIGLPGEDGLSICHYLRAHDTQIGIVFLTARGLREDRLAGLAAGADAYLVKPVDMEELALILKRLALRFDLHPHPVRRQDDFATGDWSIEPGTGFITAPNGMNVRISVSEGQILRALMNKSGSACNHAELATALELHPEEFSKHRAEVIVSRLRSKVERITGLSLPLRVVRGVGYSMTTKSCDQEPVRQQEIS